MAHSMRAYANLPDTFGCLAWECAVYIINRLPTAGIPDAKTPFVVLVGKPPDLKYMRIFAADVMFMISITKRSSLTKLMKQNLLATMKENAATRLLIHKLTN
mmetsp:Transcript_10348/g.13413  ORF Transcript_10348/g.13413 Transcript_10348/m.13413 type:complete len:102 (-) Transcript_10348:393-698(-)